MDCVSNVDAYIWNRILNWCGIVLCVFMFTCKWVKWSEWVSDLCVCAFMYDFIYYYVFFLSKEEKPNVHDFCAFIMCGIFIHSYRCCCFFSNIFFFIHFISLIKILTCAFNFSFNCISATGYVLILDCVCQVHYAFHLNFNHINWHTSP